MSTPEICVALLRGINVGRAKRVAMADLRRMMEELGYTRVRTLLNSGNLVFVPPLRMRGDHAARIERAIAATLGVVSRVIVLTADEAGAAVAGNPLDAVADNSSRLMVLVLAEASLAVELRPLLKQNWVPEAFAIKGRFGYLWCPQGVAQSPLVAAASRIVGDRGTMRNIATMTRLHDAVTAWHNEEEIA